jgi:hypothetical protein
MGADARTLRHFSSGQDVLTFDITRLPLFIETNAKLSAARGCRMYEPSYHKAKFGCSDEEAAQRIKKLKSEKSTSLNGFISRHGEETGRKMFERFQKTSAFSNSEERFRASHGDGWKEARRKQNSKGNRRCVDYWFNRQGLSIKEAKEKVKEHQRKHSGVSRQYWIDRGYSHDEIGAMFAVINKKKGINGRNREHLKKIHGNGWFAVYEKRLASYRATMEKSGRWIQQGLIDEFKKYKSLVWIYTRAALALYRLKDIELRSVNFHVDHRFSVQMGFVNDVPPEVVGSIVNLEVLPRADNCRKSRRSSITLSCLNEIYQQFISNENQKHPQKQP